MWRARCSGRGLTDWTGTTGRSRATPLPLGQTTARPAAAPAVPAAPQNKWICTTAPAPGRRPPRRHIGHSSSPWGRAPPPGSRGSRPASAAGGSLPLGGRRWRWSPGAEASSGTPPPPLGGGAPSPGRRVATPPPPPRSPATPGPAASPKEHKRSERLGRQVNSSVTC